MIPKCNLTVENRELNKLYAELREAREAGLKGGDLVEKLMGIKAKLDARYPEDWLLRLEVLELTSGPALTESFPVNFRAEIRGDLSLISQSSTEKQEMINRGLAGLEGVL